MTAQPVDQAGPYAQTAAQYWAAGWTGALPLPARRKANPPLGWSGRDGAWPSRADIQAWAEEPVEHNIGLRLPPGVLGVDVDNYGTKPGAATLADRIARWGPLPATWRSTSRDDGTSGIYLYSIPEGLAWPGTLGPGIELIQANYRYAVVWPSIHPEGRIYRWYTPEGVISASSIPTLDQLPELPDAWIAGITGGMADEGAQKADLNDLEVNAWLIKHGAGVPCPAVRHTVDHYLTDRLTGAESRHDAAKDATARLFYMASEGHTGIVQAVNEIGIRFRSLTTADSSRPEDQGEWRRLYLGAIRLAAAKTGDDDCPPDPCILPEVTTLTTPAPEIIDISTITPEEAAKATADRALEAEVTQQRIRREAKRLLDAEEHARHFRIPPSTYTLVEELQIPDEPVTYTVDKLMPTGANVLLTAQFKAGKTTLVNHLTRCLADGEPFLGTHAVAPPDGRIALFNYEVDDRQYRRWLRELNIGATPLVSVLNLRGYRLPLVVEHVEDWIVQWLQERDVKVWIVDPFARAFTGSGASENDNTEVGRFLDTLDVIKARAGVSDLVLPTHTGRAEFEEGQERARGATRLDDWADVRWMLNKDDQDQRYFSATGRDVDVEEVTLNFNEGDRQLSASLGNRQAATRRRLTDAVLAAVAREPGIPLRGLRVAVRQVAGKASNEAIDDEITLLEMSRQIRFQAGDRGARLHYPAGPTTLNKGWMSD